MAAPTFLADKTTIVQSSGGIAPFDSTQASNYGSPVDTAHTHYVPMTVNTTVYGEPVLYFATDGATTSSQYDRAQAYERRIVDEVANDIYGYEFNFPTTAPGGAQYLITETNFQSVYGRGPTTALYLRTGGGVELYLASGKVQPVPITPAYEFNSQSGAGGTPQMWAIPVAAFTFNAWHQIICKYFYSTTGTGTIEVWHRLRGAGTGSGSWTKTVDVTGVATLQCKQDGTYTVGGSTLDVINLYRAHNTSVTHHACSVFARFAALQDAYDYFDGVDPGTTFTSSATVAETVARTSAGTVTSSSTNTSTLALTGAVSASGGVATTGSGSAWVKDLGSNTSSPSSAATFTITPTAAPDPANSILLELGWNGTGTVASPGGVTDNKGNTWTLVATDTATTPARQTVQHWICLQDVLALTTSDVITVTYTIGTTNSRLGMLKELSGHVTLDKTVSSHSAANSTSVSTGTTAATTQAAEVAIATFCVGATEASWTIDGTYTSPTLDRLSNGGRALLSEIKTLSATGTQVATGTIPTTTNYASVLSTFYGTAVATTAYGTSMLPLGFASVAAGGKTLFGGSVLALTDSVLSGNDFEDFAGSSTLQLAAGATSAGNIRLQFGYTTVGGAASNLSLDDKRASKATLTGTDNASVLEMWMYLDGLGSGTGSQVARTVIYARSGDTPGALLGYSDQVTVTDGQAAGWVRFPFSTACVFSPQDLAIGIHAGANTNTIRTYSDFVSSASMETLADVYSDGPSNPFGAPTTFGYNLSVYVVYTTAVGNFASITLPLVLDPVIAVKATAKTSLTFPISLGISVGGPGTSHAVTDTPLSLSIGVAATKKAQAAVTFPITFGISANMLDPNALDLSPVGNGTLTLTPTADHTLSLTPTADGSLTLTPV